MEEETLEQMQARHRREQRDLQGRVTSKKKNATKKTRKGVTDECAALERELRERQEGELGRLGGGEGEEEEEEEKEGEQDQDEPVNGVEKQLANTTLEAPERADPAPAPAPAGKKRNRQKDRLARRAAEAEAASASAATEAAGMTDHRAAERDALSADFARLALVEKDIAPDGHCLFAAVADQLRENAVPLGDTAKAPFRAVREAAAAYMARHPDDFAPFLDEEESFEAYVRKMRDTAEWGGQLELAALAAAYGVEVRVVQKGRVEVVRPPGAGAGDAPGEGDVKATLWLAYYRHGFGLGEHYNSLRRKKPAEKP